VKPGDTVSATGAELDPDGDLWWVDKRNQFSFDSLKDILSTKCNQNNATEAKFRYYNNAGQVYVRMTPEWIFMEFWYPYVFWSGYATTAQCSEQEPHPNQCFDCIRNSGVSNPQNYDFMQQRATSPDNNCWDECIGGNTFMNTGDTDQDPVFSWAFFEAQIYRDLTCQGQPPEEYRLPPNNNVDLQIPHTFNRNMEIVRVSHASVYSMIDAQVVQIGPTEVPYVHGSWFRKWTNPSGAEWISPFKYKPPLPNPYNRNLLNGTCFTWIASKDGVTGKFGTLNEQFYVDKAGIACPNMTCMVPTTATPTKRPTYPPTPSRPTPAPTVRILPELSFTGIPCITESMDLFVIVDASKSISDESFQKEKVWLQNLFAGIKNEFNRVNGLMAAQGFSDRICFRAGFITFSHLTAMPMNLSMWDCANGGYDINVGNAIISATGRPHTAFTRFAGTHIRDALDDALLMYNRSNKTCTSFYGIALTDGLPQCYRAGPDTNQNPCLAGYRGSKFQNKLTNFYWVPVERDAPFNTDLFNCLLSPPTQNIIISNAVIPLASFKSTECQLCKTQPPTYRPTRRPTKPPTQRPSRRPSKVPTKVPTPRPTSRPTSRPTRPPTKRPTVYPTRSPSKRPSQRPTKPPTKRPTVYPTRPPTKRPTQRPTKPPTQRPTTNSTSN
jgi:hypothetical protein